MSTSNENGVTFVTHPMCPFAQKARIALEVAEIEYTMKVVDLYGPGGKPDWFLKLNPRGTVPVLDCGDAVGVFPDSDLILEQIGKGQVLGNRRLYLGEDSESARLVAEWIVLLKELLPVGKTYVTRRQKQDKLDQLLDEMENKVVGPYLVGDKVSIADCAVFPFLFRLEDEYGCLGANLKSWLQKCEGNAAFSKTIPSSWWWWW